MNKLFSIIGLLFIAQITFAGHHESGHMKKGAVIINCGRGAHLIDSDLIDALNFGQLSAATLDVFNKEPLEENHPFWEHKKIFLTPHIASLTNPESAINEIASSIRLIESGKIPKHIIDLKKGY